MRQPTTITWIIFGILLAIGLLIGVIWLLASNWDAIMNSIGVIWGGFVNWMGEVWGGFINWWNEAWGGFINWWNEMWGGFANWWIGMWGGFANWWAGVWGGFVNWLGEIWGGFTNWLTEIWNGFISWLSGAWTGLVNLIPASSPPTSIGIGCEHLSGSSYPPERAARIPFDLERFVGWISSIGTGFTGNPSALAILHDTFRNVGDFIGGVFVGIQETFRQCKHIIEMTTSSPKSTGIWRFETHRRPTPATSGTSRTRDWRHRHAAELSGR
jgi:hypothetical protein